MTELYASSRVFVNLDRPYEQGEGPITLAFTHALSASLPVVARDLPGLSYKGFIDSNGVCTDDFDTMAAFIDRCLEDRDSARTCGERSRAVARDNFSTAMLRPRYEVLIQRERHAFESKRGEGETLRRLFPFLRSPRPR
jgi:glycosyltransferase involved in cell wall biosynthesis